MSDSTTAPWDTPERSLLPAEVAELLPESVELELARQPVTTQTAFLREFTKRQKSLGGTYLRLIFMSHYGYLGRWDISFLMMVVSVVTGALVLVLGETAGAVGWIWWLVDIARVPGLVRAHNSGLAFKILRELPIEPKAHGLGEPVIEPRAHGAREPVVEAKSFLDPKQAAAAKTFEPPKPATAPTTYGLREPPPRQRGFASGAPPSPTKGFGRRSPGTVP